MQSKLPFRDGILYECANPECFYVGTLLSFEDVVWKHYYDSTLEDLDLRPTCPSCGDPMMLWHDDLDITDGLATVTK